MIYLVCYDIKNDRLRTKIADHLIDIGLDRIQYSVFMGDLNHDQKAQLLDWVGLKLHAYKQKTESDTVEIGFDFVLLPLDKYAIANSDHLGEHAPDWEYLSGEKLVLIL